MDVRLFQTDDGGEITCTNGQLVMSDGLAEAAYLSMFGGNEDDSGSDGDEPKEWWGNKLEAGSTRKYRSETQFLLRSIACVSGNISRIKDAAERDLAWMKDELAASVDVAVSVPAPNRINITVAIAIKDKRFEVVFTEAWKLRSQALAA
jgi:phage gp46-like protein